MKVCSLFVFSFLFFMIFLHLSLAQGGISVGVSPPMLDLGEIEKGSAKVGSFDILTSSKVSLLVHLNPENGNIDFFDLRYKDRIFNYSEQDVASWIGFFANPVELKISEDLEGVVTPIRGSKEISFILDVPNNAEPGYHIINIKPIPTVPPGAGGQAGTQIVPITTVTVMFKVPGIALRKGIILDSTVGDFDGHNLIISNYFQNIGTDTITARAYQEIYDKDGNLVTESFSSKALVRPKETTILKTLLPVTGLYLGDYSVFTNVTYITGSVSKNSTITLYEIPTEMEKIEYMPIWPIIIAIIIVISIIIYRRVR